MGGLVVKKKRRVSFVSHSTRRLKPGQPKTKGLEDSSTHPIDVPSMNSTYSSSVVASSLKRVPHVTFADYWPYVGAEQVPSGCNENKNPKNGTANAEGVPNEAGNGKTAPKKPSSGKRTASGNLDFAKVKIKRVYYQDHATNPSGLSTIFKNRPIPESPIVCTNGVSSDMHERELEADEIRRKQMKYLERLANIERGHVRMLAHAAAMRKLNSNKNVAGSRDVYRPKASDAISQTEKARERDPSFPINQPMFFPCPFIEVVTIACGEQRVRLIDFTRLPRFELWEIHVSENPFKNLAFDPNSKRHFMDLWKQSLGPVRMSSVAMTMIFSACRGSEVTMRSASLEKFLDVEAFPFFKYIIQNGDRLKVFMRDIDPKIGVVRVVYGVLIRDPDVPDNNDKVEDDNDQVKDNITARWCKRVLFECPNGLLGKWDLQEYHEGTFAAIDPRSEEVFCIDMRWPGPHPPEKRQVWSQAEKLKLESDLVYNLLRERPWSTNPLRERRRVKNPPQEVSCNTECRPCNHLKGRIIEGPRAYRVPNAPLTIIDAGVSYKSTPSPANSKRSFTKPPVFDSGAFSYCHHLFESDEKRWSTLASEKVDTRENEHKQKIHEMAVHRGFWR